MAGEFGLHPLAVEDALNAHQRPKLEEYDDSLFVVLKTVRYDEETQQIELGDVMLFVGDSFVVTVRHGEGRALADVRQAARGAARAARLRAVGRALRDRGRVVDDYTDDRARGRGGHRGGRGAGLLPRAQQRRRPHLQPQARGDRVPPGGAAAGRADGQARRRRRAARRTSRCSRSSATSPTTRSGCPSRSRASTTCSPRCSTPTSPRSACSRTRTCAGSRPGWPSPPCRR